MSKRRAVKVTKSRRSYTREFKEEALRMLLDGRTASSVCEHLGLSSTNLLDRWMQEFLRKEGAVASILEQRVRELKAELRRVERERESLKSVEYFRPGRIADVFAAEEQLVRDNGLPVCVVYDVLGVSSLGFYSWRFAGPSDHAERNAELPPMIQEIFQCFLCGRNCSCSGGNNSVRSTSSCPWRCTPLSQPVCTHLTEVRCTEVICARLSNAAVGQTVVDQMLEVGTDRIAQYDGRCDHSFQQKLINR